MTTAVRFRIHKFDSAGNHIISFGPTRDEKTTSPLLQNSPAAIALDPAGEFIYLAVAYLNQVYKYNTSTGELVDTWGDPEQGPGEFYQPQGIAVDPDGNVYVADTGNQRILKLDSDGQLIVEWGGSGAGEGEFNEPLGITIDNADHLFVTDSGNNRVQVFNLEGQFLAAWGSPGSGEGEFSTPGDVAADTEGHVYVMDKDNLRIQKFLTTVGLAEKLIFLPMIIK